MYVCLCGDKSIAREKFFALQVLSLLLWAFCHPQLRRLGSEDVPVTWMSKDRHTSAPALEQESTAPCAAPSAREDLRSSLWERSAQPAVLRAAHQDPSHRFVVLQLKWDFNWGALSLAVQFVAQAMALGMLLVENTCTV